MKIKSLSNLFIIALLVVFSTCTKQGDLDNTLASNAKSNEVEVRVITYNDNDKGTITLLEFVNTEAYERTISQLEKDVDKHEEGFVGEYAHLNDDELNDMEEAIGFNYQLPLIDFEKKVGFKNSMRQIFVIDEDKWLDNEVLDPETDPSNKYAFDLAEMTLLNTQGEVKVGKSILKLTPDGFVEFQDGDFNKLIRFNNGDMSVLLEPNVVSNLDLKDDEPDCKGRKRKDYWKMYDNDTKIVRMRVAIRNYPTRCVSKSKLTSWKQRNNGSWKRFRRTLSVGNQCYIYNTDCDILAWQEWSGWKVRKRSSLTKSNIYWAPVPRFRAKNGESVYGEFKWSTFHEGRVLVW